jgi:hypothetical protein
MLGHGLGGFDEGLIIQSYQRADRRVTSLPLDAGHIRIGAVECDQVGMGCRPLEVGVHAPAVPILSLAGLPLETAVVGQVGDTGRNGRKDARAANFPGKQPTGGERGVADDFRLDTKSILPVKQVIPRINLFQFRAVPGRLPVSRRMKRYT